VPVRFVTATVVFAVRIAAASGAARAAAAGHRRVAPVRRQLDDRKPDGTLLY